MRDLLEPRYQAAMRLFTSSEGFRDLAEGKAPREAYDLFICRLFAVHVTAPRYFAFLYALVAPGSEQAMRDRLLARLGRGMPEGVPQPALLERLLRAAELHDRANELNKAALVRLAPYVTAPQPFPTLRDLGLSAYVRILAFEFLLHHAGPTMATFLREHRKIPDADLIWLDVQRKGTENIEEIFSLIGDYVSFYEMAAPEVQQIIAASLDDDIFVRSYLEDPR